MSTYFEAWGERKTLRGWSKDERAQISLSALYERVRCGWTIEDAVSLPRGARELVKPAVKEPAAIVKIRVNAKLLQRLQHHGRRIADMMQEEVTELDRRERIRAQVREEAETFCVCGFRVDLCEECEA